MLEHNHNCYNYPPLVINRTVATLGSDFDNNKKTLRCYQSHQARLETPYRLLFRWKHSVRNGDVPSAYLITRGDGGADTAIILSLAQYFHSILINYRLYYRITSTNETTY